MGLHYSLAWYSCPDLDFGVSLADSQVVVPDLNFDLDSLALLGSVVVGYNFDHFKEDSYSSDHSFEN